MRYRKFTYYSPSTETTSAGIEAWLGNEPYCTIAEQEPECFVQGRHEHPNPNCLWASERNTSEVNHLIREGKLKPTGRTTDISGTYYEVMPDPDWWDGLRAVSY